MATNNDKSRLWMCLISLLVVTSARLAELHADDDRVVEPVVDDDVLLHRVIRFVGFGFNVQNTAQTRIRLESILSNKTALIDSFCSLNDPQRQKLHLAGRGDLKRFFDRVDELSQRSKRDSTVEDPDGDLNEWQQLDELSQDEQFPGPDSLFMKTLHRILTDEQSSKFDETVLSRRRFSDGHGDRISLGDVRTGAMAEIGVRLFTAETIPSDTVVTVRSPGFLRVSDARMGRIHAVEHQRSAIDVNFVLSTTDPGEFEGTAVVLIGSDMFALISVSATVLANEHGLRKVLVVETPFHRSSLNDAAVLDRWLQIVRTAKLDVSYRLVERGKSSFNEVPLEKFDVVLLGDVGLLKASAQDFDRLTAFVKAGGRVIVSASHVFPNTVNSTNEFISRFGLKMLDKEPRPSGLHAFKGEDIVARDQFQDVRQLTFHRPSPISVAHAPAASILVRADQFPHCGFAVMAPCEQGSVVVIGTAKWWTWISSEGKRDADNALLLTRLIGQS